MEVFEVGGCVRDSLLGLPSKDIDFVCLAPSFDAMHQELIAQGFKIYIAKPEFVTIRAGVPKKHALASRTKDADFVLARKDGQSSDGRRPDSVEPGTLADDLARRDFTVNALARDPISGKIIDLHGGVADLEARRLRFVGDPMTRIREDGLRVLRGLRFMITKEFSPEINTWSALRSEEASKMLQCVSVERIGDELNKMLASDCIASLELLACLPRHTREAIFRGKLRLQATLKEV